MMHWLFNLKQIHNTKFYLKQEQRLQVFDFSNFLDFLSDIEQNIP